MLCLFYSEFCVLRNRGCFELVLDSSDGTNKICPGLLINTCKFQKSNCWKDKK